MFKKYIGQRINVLLNNNYNKATYVSIQTLFGVLSITHYVSHLLPYFSFSTYAFEGIKNNYL